MGFCGQYGHAPSLQLWAHIFRLERGSMESDYSFGLRCYNEAVHFRWARHHRDRHPYGAGGQISLLYNGGSGGAVASVFGRTE